MPGTWRHGEKIAKPSSVIPTESRKGTGNFPKRKRRHMALKPWVAEFDTHPSEESRRDY